VIVSVVSDLQYCNFLRGFCDSNFFCVLVISISAKTLHKKRRVTPTSLGQR
jgi:hypothetical protein